MDCGTDTNAASWKIISTPRTASSTCEVFRRSPSRTSKRSPSNCWVRPSWFSRFPELKLSSTLTELPCSSNVRTICDPMNPAPPVTRYFMLSPCTPQYCADRPQNDLEVHSKRPMFDVVKIIFDFDGRLCDTGNISIVDLCPTRQSGF